MDAYKATVDHIGIIARKRERLSEMQQDAEAQLLHRAAADYASGAISWCDLFEVYEAYRVHALPGYGKRWNAVMPISWNRLVSLVRHGDRFRPDPDGSWRGAHPFEPEQTTPPNGQTVVYVLYDEENTPCYVGSTEHFRSRMSAHVSGGKRFVRWIAYPCTSRAAGYALESRLLAEHMPYLNKKASA